MSDQIEEHSEVYNRYLQLSTPTEEDFKRVFTEDELKELCMKHKCKVDIWRWNVVHEYRLLFTESGRYQRWSERRRLGMLAKAVNKMKPSILYEEEEIKRIRREEWEFQLKDNILSLDLWKRERLRHEQLEVDQLEDIDDELQSQQIVNTESMNMDELLTQSENQLPENCVEQEDKLETEPNTMSVNAAELIPQVKRGVFPVCLHQANTEIINSQERTEESVEREPTVNNCTIRKDEVTPAIPKQKEDILLENEELGFFIDEYSSDSVETVLNNEQPNPVIVEILNSVEIAPEIENIYSVNTLSMTVDSRTSSQSQDLPIQQSEDAIAQSYDHFRNVIPLTSTQSQNQEFEA